MQLPKQSHGTQISSPYKHVLYKDSLSERYYEYMYLTRNLLKCIFYKEREPKFKRIYELKNTKSILTHNYLVFQLKQNMLGHYLMESIHAMTTYIYYKYFSHNNVFSINHNLHQVEMKFYCTMANYEKKLCSDYSRLNLYSCKSTQDCATMITKMFSLFVVSEDVNVCL